jgi:thymidine kinase
MAKLHFYYSAMNAGKSTTLLQSSYNYRERGMETLLFTARLDKRFGEGVVASRIGLQSEAMLFDETTDIVAYVKEALATSPKLACVLVDEAQFLTRNQVASLTTITTELRLPVLAYGIRSDFQGEPFEGSQYLLAWAEEITEIKTICTCGRKATMNMRIDDEGNPVSEGASVLTGGNERYVSVCMKHFKEYTGCISYDTLASQ